MKGSKGGQTHTASIENRPTLAATRFDNDKEEEEEKEEKEEVPRVAPQQLSSTAVLWRPADSVELHVTLLQTCL